MPAPNTLLTLELQTITPGGDALARHEGMVIFVPMGVPGERVTARLTERKKHFARAEIVDILSAAPERTDPACGYFGRCGGCQWQHIDYAAQLRFKRAIVEEQFARIGKFQAVTVLPTLPCPTPYGYRNRARFARAAGDRPGYRAAHSHAVIAVDDCPILEADLNERLHAAAKFGLPTERGDWEVRADDGKIQIGAFAYTVAPDAFFQVNSAVAARLVDEVMERLALRGGERVLDLYCGVGLFTLPISLCVDEVIGVEFSAPATVDARRNLEALAHNYPTQAAWTILAGDVAEVLTRPVIARARWDAVVVDPPRAGIDRMALDRLIALHPARIVYVSCDPATQARDARILADAGYDLGPIQPLDMFPQTHHVESVLSFVLRG